MVGEVGYLPYGPVISLDADAGPSDRGGGCRIAASRPPKDEDAVRPAAAGRRRHQPRASATGLPAVCTPASPRLPRFAWTFPETKTSCGHGLPKRLQAWTRKWPARGVSVRRGTQGDVALLARLHAASAQYQGFEPIPFDYLANLYPRLAPDGHAELFIGEVEGTPVAARLYTGCGGVFKARLAGMDRDSAAARLSVPAAVEWEAIRWAKANGYRWFDFGGIREAAVSVIESERSDVSR